MKPTSISRLVFVCWIAFGGPLSSRGHSAEPAASQESGGATGPGVPGNLSAAEVPELLRRGRRQYATGEPTAAAQTFARVLELDPQNLEARRFLERISAGETDRNANRTEAVAHMLNEVEQAWHPAGGTPDETSSGGTAVPPSPVQAKLDSIVVPAVNFSGLELSRVVTTLSAVAEEFDTSGEVPKGVNIVLLDPAGANPAVNITLHNLPLRRVLDLVTESVGCQYEVQADAVVVRPAGGPQALETRFFPVSRSTVLRLTGRSGGSEPPGKRGDPLAGGAHETTSTVRDEGAAIRNFLQLAGVGFESVPGSTLAFDGSQLIVTQTPRNLERVARIMNRYATVRQVEIEAKFMEVQDGALEELGVNWSVASRPGAVTTALYQTANRSVADAFTNLGNNKDGRIVGGTDGLDQSISNSPPSIPGTNNLGVNTSPLATVTGMLGEFNVNAVVRALAQKSGTELLSAPKLTVLSGSSATITVAQELRYPQAYGQVQSQVGTGSSSGGGSAGVAITAGTPQDFTTRNIGVELKVTPTVEEDDRSISLELNPKVTEFEGFVEYGGQSIAIAGSPATTVTIPSGFYQPIFGVRELTTRVTLWDGATLVMGGLTRQDVKKSNDKVPVIGNIPVLGRLFRSTGESTQKRNLLIFVTARLVTPGGASITPAEPRPASSVEAAPPKPSATKSPTGTAR